MQCTTSYALGMHLHEVSMAVIRKLEFLEKSDILWFL